MFIVECIIFIIIIYLGMKTGGIGLGLFSCVGVLILTLCFNHKIGNIPLDVVAIILSVTIMISVLYLSDGINYLIYCINKLLLQQPKYIIIVAPVITYFITLITGTSYTALSIFPVIMHISKKNNIQPVYPLSISVVASQVAIIASPISAAFIYFSKILEPFGINYFILLTIFIPSTFIAVLLTSLFTSIRYNFYHKLHATNIISYNHFEKTNLFSIKGKYSFILFCIGISTILVYNILCSIYTISNSIPRTESIILFMLVISLVIHLVCKTNIKKITQTKIFQIGMEACICIIGVAWFSDTFINAHMNIIKLFILYIIQYKPIILAIMLLFITSLCYSQAVTTRAIIPYLIILGVPLKTIISIFTAVAGVFILPTYPTILYAVKIDDTGSTKIGKYVFNHPFLIPGISIITLSIIINFLIIHYII
ncbi:anaerobic C4-dicarboxylate transporter family protein [Enterobacteriaceae endosymbiont of Macroplea appendiculata]|uniref:anaerobic C4-dicarboxylate transporter family protein n=1 Tax=Enterobacteriaceae endosymbiont of Macroplea appendiculata TaxID=2675790 RepID=UPI001448FCFC|nr:anaerobic C4-dicarboxylate transporter family protein [Enterobacteriaceae endosymbiont of Macroplea appendiculata]QJC30800.1 anaerobic C4-dicarboxylate transporter [Enterobacteriaceae endosymbiont of Macroplea appendiculata]